MSRTRKNKAQFRSFPDKHCLKCEGTGYKPATWLSRLTGREVEGVTQCGCWITVDLRKPKKVRPPVVFDGKSAAMGVDA